MGVQMSQGEEQGASAGDQLLDGLKVITVTASQARQWMKQHCVLQGVLGTESCIPPCWHPRQGLEWEIPQEITQRGTEYPAAIPLEGPFVPNTGTTIKAGAVFDQWDWRAQYPVGPGFMTEDDGFWGQHPNSYVVVMEVT